MHHASRCLHDLSQGLRAHPRPLFAAGLCLVLAGCGLAGTAASTATGAAAEAEQARQAQQLEQKVQKDVEAAQQKAAEQRAAAEKQVE